MINLQSQQVGESLPLTATVNTALCVGAGGSSGSLADKPILRNARGQLLIPASQLKGRLRHECEKLARGLGWPVCQSPKPKHMCPQRAGLTDAENTHFQRDEYRIDGDSGHHCLICQIFGNPSLPSQVEVNDLICHVAADTLPEVLRPGVTLNRRRLTAEDQKLYFLETSPANLNLEFQGSLYLHPQAPPYTKLLLSAALRHIHALGGSKSAGLGWVTWTTLPELDHADWQGLRTGGVV